MKYGYARVSTVEQNLQSQIEQLEAEGCTKIYKDKFTGTKKDRKEFQKLLKVLKDGDTLVVTKLDRFARSTIDGINTIKELFERGIKVHILNMGLVENTPTGRLIFNVMLADRKSTRLNSSHVAISYAVFCLKKKKKRQ